MAERSMRLDPGLIAGLNDLLQLDHDAAQAYTIAIGALESESFKETLRAFREDHERHISDLSQVIRENGGLPIDLAHVPTGFFKRAVQQVGALGGDRSILLAFKANEGQVRDKYLRSAEEPGYPPEVAEVIRRNASDEVRHYTWAVERLEEMGAGEDTVLGRAAGAFERVHEATADAVEDAERRLMAKAEGARQSVAEVPDRIRSRAGQGIDSAAEAVDRAGRWIESRDGAPARAAGSVMHGLADTLENAANYLRSRDFGEMRTDMEARIDRHPLRSVLIAVAAGIVLGRLMR